MTEQHDAPSKLKDTNLMRVQIQDALRFWHDKLGYPAAQEGEIHIGADIVLAAISTQAAPSGLVDAVRAFLAAQDAWDAFTVEHDDEGHRHHTLEWNRLGAAQTAARLALDATLSGQPSTPPTPASERDMAAFGAGEASCVYAPGADQALVRRAFEDGAAYAYTGKLPPEPATLSCQQGGAVPAGDLRPGLRYALATIRKRRPIQDEGGGWYKMDWDASELEAMFQAEVDHLDRTATAVTQAANLADIADIVARFEQIDKHWSMRLTRLVDGVSTYEARADGQTREFDNTDDLYEWIGEVKRRGKERVLTEALALRARLAAQPAPAGTWTPHPNNAPDGADAATVLASVRVCAQSWDEDARLVGNVRAGDIVRAIDDVERRYVQPAPTRAGTSEPEPRSDVAEQGEG